MALRKNRTEILDRIITKAELGTDYYCWGWDWDDDYDWHDEYCDCYSCMPIDFEYLPEEFFNSTITVTQKDHFSEMTDVNHVKLLK